MWFCLLVARCGMAVHRWGGEASVLLAQAPWPLAVSGVGLAALGQ